MHPFSGLSISGVSIICHHFYSPLPHWVHIPCSRLEAGLGGGLISYLCCSFVYLNNGMVAKMYGFLF